MSAEAELHCGDVLEWFSRFSGGAVPVSRRGELEAGIRRVMQAHNFTNTSRLKDALVADHQVLDSLVSELTVPETYFFRDLHHFDLIRERAVPEFIAACPAEAVFRAWSAGCATGEEAYSLAILFDELGIGQRSSILATDICRASLQKAIRGSYGGWSFRNEAGEYAKEHFRRHGNRLVLDERIRSRVSFQFGNLAADPHTAAAGFTGGDMNLILCRNVMIYFDPEVIRRLAAFLFGALAPGGWLIVGPSDPPLWDYAPFEIISAMGGLFYRRPVRSGAFNTRGPTAILAASVTRPERKAAAKQQFKNLLQSSPSRPQHRDNSSGLPADGKAADLPQSPAAAPAQAAESEAARITRLIREAANAGSPNLSALAESAAQAHPLNIEIQYLHAVALLSERRFEAACVTARRIVYLDGSLVMGHFILATALARNGQKTAARRSYRKVKALCAALPPEEQVQFADGETASMLRDAARLRLQAKGAT